MTQEELINLAYSLGIQYRYVESNDYITLIGINGGNKNMYISHDRLKNGIFKPATPIDFANHLKQMGRDSLKMELNDLLSITGHH